LENLKYKGRIFNDFTADERAEIILREFTLNAETTQKEIIQILNEFKYEYKILWIINGIIIKNADKLLINKLSQFAYIRQISIDQEYKIEEIEEKKY